MEIYNSEVELNHGKKKRLGEKSTQVMNASKQYKYVLNTLPWQIVEGKFYL
jgi:hypothetical protein